MGVIQAELLFIGLSPVSEVEQLPRSGSWTWGAAHLWEEAGKEREVLLSSELIAACSPPAFPALCFPPSGLWHSQEEAFGLALPKPLFSISFSAENQTNL